MPRKYEVKTLKRLFRQRRRWIIVPSIDGRSSLPPSKSKELGDA